MKEQWIRLLYAAAFLWTAAIPDIRTKKIPLWIPRAFGIPAVISAGVFPTEIGRSMLWSGVVPGLIFIVFALAMRGKMGMGDGICIAICGLITGAAVVAAVLLWASVAAGIAGVWLIAVRRRSGKCRIPFLPFLAAGCSAEFVIALAASIQESVCK